ncbi:MAG TPA: winged helix-turn-helix domain-containing protein [Bryobacteraceae bacterium]|nr:winged helix-turn-helix domain-containing protein [Bryobacteraceae bacterium]
MSFPAPRSMSGITKLRFGPFEVDLDNRELRKHGIRVKLQRKPFQILETMLQRPGQLVLRTDLAKLLWPGMHVNFDRSLNTAVNALRRALGDTSRNARFIETRTGLGYRFLVSVEEVGGARPDAGIQLVRSNVPGAGADVPQDCLKGRYFCHKLTAEDLHKGVAHFNAALAQDPQCAFAYAGLADAYCLSALLNMGPPREIYPRAKEMAMRALRARQDLGEAHAALASVKRLFEWDWAGAEAEYLTALVLSSNSAMTHQAYGAHLAATGKAKEALRELRHSEEIDPLCPRVNVGVAWGLYVARDFQGASEQSWKVLAMEPKFGAAQYTLGLAYEQMGLTEDAAVELRNARTCSGDHPAVLAALAHVHACYGDASQAARMLGELEDLSQRRYVSPYWLALVYTGLQDRERALELLGRAYEERDVWLTWLGVEPRFDALRPETRFTRLLQSIGLGTLGTPR